MPENLLGTLISSDHKSTHMARLIKISYASCAITTFECLKIILCKNNTHMVIYSPDPLQVSCCWEILPSLCGPTMTSAELIMNI